MQTRRSNRNHSFRDLATPLDAADNDDMEEFRLNVTTQSIYNRYGLTMVKNFIQGIKYLNNHPGVNVQDIYYFDNFQWKALKLIQEFLDASSTVGIPMVPGDNHMLGSDLIPREYVMASRELPMWTPKYSRTYPPMEFETDEYRLRRNCIWHITPTAEIVAHYEAHNARLRAPPPVIDLTQENDSGVIDLTGE